MPRSVVREAKAKAARQGMTLAKVVTDALVRSSDTDESADDDLAEAIDWYAQNRARLLRRYRGEYLAILGDRMLDHDEDFAALAERVFRTIGERPVYMPKVGAEEELVRVRSPRGVP
jgi:hypothetical protein